MDQIWREPPFYQVVKKTYNTETHMRDLRFPDVLVCEDCGGVRYVYPGCFEGGDEGYVLGAKTDNPLLALQISMARFGYNGNYHNPDIVEPKTCCTLHNGCDKGTLVRDWLKLYDKHIHFPTLTVCSGCGGYTGFWEKKSIKDPWLSLRIALVQFGERTCRNYDNNPPNRACDCGEKLDGLQELVCLLPLIEDSGWSMNVKTSRPMRGIRDYDRTMFFERDLTKREMETLVEWLTKKDCPGWTGINTHRHEEGRYSFCTTWDSSD